jgi:hypothetical protein
VLASKLVKVLKITLPEELAVQSLRTNFALKRMPDRVENIKQEPGRLLREHFPMDGTHLIKIEVEGRKSRRTPSLSTHKIWYTLLMKDLAVVKGFQSLVNICSICIRKYFCRTFQHFAFFTHDEMEWHRIS